MSELDILLDPEVRHWLWWTIIPVAVIIAGAIASTSEVIVRRGEKNE